MIETMDTAPSDTKTASKKVAGGSILVAIPTLNEEAHIEACIRSLLKGDQRLKDVHIVVADGGSTDRTVAIVTELMTELPNLSLLHNPKRLQSAAINLVAQSQHADGKTCLVRCDAHAVYPAAYVTRIADALAQYEADSLVVCMDSVGADTCFQKANAWVVDTPFGSGGSAHRGGTRSGPVDHGHHAGFRLQRFLELGGYDDTFSHNEDAEYDHRLTEAGGSIWLDASIRLDYHPRSTPSALARQYYNYGRGRARNLLKHRARPKIRQMVPVAICLGLLGGLMTAPVFPLTLLVPAAYLALLAGISLLGGLATKSACGLLAGPAAGIMHVAWGSGFLRQVLGSRSK